MARRKIEKSKKDTIVSGFGFVAKSIQSFFLKLTFYNVLSGIALLVGTLALSMLFVFPAVSQSIIATIKPVSSIVNYDTSITNIDNNSLPVYLSIDGKVSKLYPTKTVVGDIFKEFGVVIPFFKGTYPSLKTEIAPSETIYIGNIETRTVDEDIVIPFEKVTEKTESLSKGETKVIQQGENGISRTTYIIDSVGGHEIDRNAFSSVIASPVKNEITGIGYLTAGRITPSRGAIMFEGHKETYYNLNMSAFARFGNLGVRDDGAKIYTSGKYKDQILLACHTKYRYKSRMTSIGKGICVDTGGFATHSPEQIDIATNW
jgi:uncharacterized protein YabE (DUF348 family)